MITKVNNLVVRFCTCDNMLETYDIANNDDLAAFALSFHYARHAFQT